MKISIRDIGVVHKADIQLDGLTVLAGENGVGKSAIGKAVYALAQSIVRLQTSTSNDMLKRFMPFLLNQVSDSDKDFLTSFIDTSRSNYEPRELATISKALRTRYPDLVEKWNKDIENGALSFDHGKIVAQEHDVLKASVFSNAYHNQQTGSNSSSIAAHSDDERTTTIFNIEEGKTTLGGEFGTQYLGTPILIETPFILSLYRYIKENLAFNNHQNKLLPDYTKVLVRKISESSYTPDYNLPICKAIQSIIQGRIILEDDQLFYENSHQIKFPIQNVATGIKSLGLLQLLIAGNAINQNAVLIIDEPEVHLHPKWQLEYARVVVELVKAGVKIIINTHSSYFIQALDIHSENEGIAASTNFYLGKMTEKGSVFEHLNESLEPLYQVFAAPSMQLMVERARGNRKPYAPKKKVSSTVQEDQISYKKTSNDETA
jgi:AAA15 family ATPase/GTPase